jgi:hypothetical protein
MGTTIPEATAVPVDTVQMVEVTAPATLSEGRLIRELK